MEDIPANLLKTRFLKAEEHGGERGECVEVAEDASGKQAVSLEELLLRIKDEASKIEDTTIFYNLKEHKVCRITSETVETVKYVLAAQMAGLPYATTDLVSTLRGVSKGTATTTLHILGDKKILLLLRRGGRRLYYRVSPSFAEKLLPQATERFKLPVERS